MSRRPPSAPSAKKPIASQSPQLLSPGKIKDPALVKFSEGAMEGCHREIIHITPAKAVELNLLIRTKMSESGRPWAKADSSCPLDRAEIEMLIHDKGGDRCICSICTCGKHKCPSRLVRYKYPSQMKSLYMQDFIEQPLGGPTDMFNSNKIRQAHLDHPMDGKSSYKTDYVAHPIGPPGAKSGQRPTTAGIPFSGTSSYQMDYPDWGTSQLPPSSKAAPNIYSMPFSGKSTYTDTYIPPDLNARTTKIKANKRIFCESAF